MNSKIDKLDDYIYLKMSGMLDTNSVKECMTNLHDECIESNYSKVLIDFLDVDLKSLNLRKKIIFITLLMDLFKMDTVKIAGLVENKYFDSAAKRFIYLANLNFKGFHNRNEAIEWLNQ
jgi:hypothetical protein